LLIFLFTPKRSLLAIKRARRFSSWLSLERAFLAVAAEHFKGFVSGTVSALPSTT
jgi:hypothetical protein